MLLRHAHATSRRPVRLYTFQQNAASRRFYERNGYVVAGLCNGENNEERCPDVLYELRAGADST
jgi:RimJ/RimL family protein N-acetyltransferase